MWRALYAIHASNCTCPECKPWTAMPKHPPIPAAAEVDVMREQLEYLLEHVERGMCDCSLCMRYLAVRSVLMAPFSENARKSGA